MSVRPIALGALFTLALRCVPGADPGPHRPTPQSLSPPPTVSVSTAAASSPDERTYVDASSPLAPEPSRSATGSVMVQRIRAHRVTRSVVIAFFYDTRYAGAPSTRTDGVFGGCKFEVYDKSAEEGTSTTRPSAGTIEVATSRTKVALTTGGGSVYLGSPTLDPLAVGDRVTFRAAGDSSGVPSFEGAVAVPEFVSVISPTMARGASPTVQHPRSQPLTVSWTGSATDLLVVELAATSADNKIPTLICRVAAKLGRLTIPPAALARLPEGSALMTVEQVAARHVRAGEFDVELSVRNQHGYAYFDLE